jgi:hypothetical protein
MHFLYKFKADWQIPLPPFSCPALSSRFTISAMKYAKRSRYGVVSICYVLRVSLLSFMVEAAVKDTRCASYFKQRLAGYMVTCCAEVELEDFNLPTHRKFDVTSADGLPGEASCPLLLFRPSDRNELSLVP